MKAQTLLTLAEAASRLGLSRCHLYSLMEKGLLTRLTTTNHGKGARGSLFVLERQVKRLARARARAERKA